MAPLPDDNHDENYASRSALDYQCDQRGTFVCNGRHGHRASHQHGWVVMERCTFLDISCWIPRVSQPKAFAGRNYRRCVVAQFRIVISGL